MKIKETIDEAVKSIQETQEVMLKEVERQENLLNKQLSLIDWKLDIKLDEYELF